MSQTASASTLRQLEREYLTHKELAVYSPKTFLESLVSIVDKDRKTVPFILNPPQHGYYRNRTLRDIILKPRQLGFSILVSGLFLQDTIFTPNTTSVVLAHTQKDSIALFERAKFMFNSIPDEFKPSVQYSSRMELAFGDMNSRFYVGSAEAKDFGRGRTINNLHCSEVSAPAFTQDFLDGIFEAVPKSGWIVLESTARGEGGPFFDLYMGAKNSRYPARRSSNEFTAHYYRWYETPEYREAFGEEEVFEFSPEENDLALRLGLAREQIKWRRLKKNRLRAKFVQEYPEEDDADAFLKSGSAVFDVEMLAEIDKRLSDQMPQEIWLGGDLYIYKVAEQGAEYVVGGDPAEGDARSNNSAAIVCRVKPLPIEQVALLVGKWTPDMFAEKIYRIGKAYNDALLAVERNNHGHAVLQALTNGITRRGVVLYPPYPNIYLGPDKKQGWLTSNLSRPQMIDELDKAMRNGEILIVSKRFIEEAKRFVFSKTGMGSKQGDDIVMAQAIALMAIMTGGFAWFF